MCITCLTLLLAKKLTMDVLDLFPRSILKGELEPSMLSSLQSLAAEVLANPENSPDASAKLAGQLNQQRELDLNQLEVQNFCNQAVLPGCERWIRHVIDRQPPQGRGPWTPGRYRLQMVDVWLNSQRAGDYNPTHTHGGSFSGVAFLQVPSQIRPESFDGQLCFHGPEEWHIQSFRTGMAHYVLPVPGEFYVFPAWQPHSVMPFRGEGERWSLAFNVLALPKTKDQPKPQDEPTTSQFNRNVSLSSQRTEAKGF